MPNLTPTVGAALGLSVLFSWLVYVPLFMRMLRRESEEEFRRNRGKYFFFGASAGFLYYYFLSKQYLALGNRKIAIHGRILTITYCYASLAFLALLFIDVSRRAL